MAVADGDWISLHTFYPGDLDGLLTAAVAPLVQELEGQEAIRGYFYLRYWNGGPHLRLRLLPATGVPRAAVTAAALERLQGFLAQRPGEPLAPETYQEQAAEMDRLRTRLTAAGAAPPEHLEAAEPLQPANTVQVRPYRFDLRRYGGSHARSISESHFCRSSELALAVVVRTPGPPGVRRALALRMMAAAPAALGLSPAEAADLFRSYGAALQHLFPHLGDGDDRLRRWGFVPFAQRREEIRGMIGGEEEGDRSPLARLFLQAWAAALAEAVAGLTRCRAEGQLQNQPQSIVLDYLHLLANRLGIPPHEEFYLVYLLAHGFAAL